MSVSGLQERQRTTMIVTITTVSVTPAAPLYTVTHVVRFKIKKLQTRRVHTAGG